MSIRKEIRIGLLTVISALVFFAGFYFLRGSNLFSSENEYIAYYDDIQGLGPSSQVLIRGMVVGRVEKVSLTNEDRVEVLFAVSDDIKIPEGTVAQLSSTDLLGTKAISLQLGTGSQELESKSVMPGTVEGGLIDAISVELTPLIQSIGHAVGSLDTILLSVNNILDEHTKTHLRNSVANLDATMEHLEVFSKRLHKESDHLAGIIDNAHQITSTLADNSSRIGNIIENVETTTSQLSAAPISSTIANLEQAIQQIHFVLGKINNNEGSLGLLVNDKALYNNLSQSLSTLNSLMADLEAHPSKYINVTIFGKKRQ